MDFLLLQRHKCQLKQWRKIYIMWYVQLLAEDTLQATMLQRTDM